MKVDFTTEPCASCGACCKGTLLVEVLPADRIRLPVINDHDTPNDRLVSFGQVCPFYADGGCQVYADRPVVCRAMEVGGPECEYAREREGLPALGGSLSG